MAAISKDYAVALFAIACEEERVEELWSALERVHTVLLESTELCAVLDAPSLSTAERLSLLDRIFEDTLPTHVLSLLKLLAEKRRISLFSDIRKEYRTLLDAHNSLTTAHVISAVPMTEEEKDALCRRLTAISGGTVTLDTRIDPDILGGLIVEMNGQVTDGSLRHRLDEIKDVMNQ